MKRVFLVVLLLATSSLSAVAAGPSFVEQFLARYRPTTVSAVPPPSNPAVVLAALQQGGQVSVALDDVLRLMLQNNLDVTVNTLPPQTAQFLINTFLQPFDPSLRISATTGRNTVLGTSSLSGAPTLSTLTNTYSVGYGQTLLR